MVQIAGPLLATLKEQWVKLLPVVKEQSEKALEELRIKIKDEFIPFLIDLGKDLFEERENQENVLYEEVVILNCSKLYDLAKQSIVSGSNEVVAYLKKDDDCYHVYLAYSKDKELLPKEQNKYLIIRAEGIAPDVTDLFAESDLIILK